MKKRIIDENGRLFGKVSLIDIIVVLAVAAVVLAAALKSEVMSTTSGTIATEPVEYTIVVKDIRQTVADMFREGDEVWTEGGVSIGKITGVDNQQAITQSQLVDGSYVEGIKESKIDSYVTILVDCSFSNGRYFANRTVGLFINQEIKLVTKYVKFPAYVTEINPLG